MVKLEFVCSRWLNFCVKHVLFFVFVLLPGSPSFANSIDVLNIEWQPYYYKNHTEISGHAKNIVEMVAKKAGLDANYHLKPWDTVYEEGLTVPGSVIAGIGRIDSREALFHWIGPINRKTTIYAYGLKAKSIQLQDASELGNYLTAVERNMYYHDFMIKMGFEKKTYPVSDVASLIKLLHAGRVDFILLEKERMQVEFARLGYDVSTVEAKTIAFSAQSYMTISKASDESLVERLKTAYQQLESIGEIVLH